MKMKWIAAIALFVAFSGTVYAASANGEYKGFSVVNVELNGQKVTTEVPAINVDNITLIPLRFFSESMGAQVKWDPNTFTASVAVKPETNTSGATGGENAAPKEDPKQKLNQTVSAQYRKVAELARDFKDLSQAMRYAEELITKRNDDYFAKKVETQHLKLLEDRQLQLLDEASKLQKQTDGQNIDIAPMFIQLNLLAKSLNAYKDALIELSYYNDSKKADKLDNYIYFSYQGYDSAYDAAEQADAKSEEFAKGVIGGGTNNGTA